MTIEDAGRRENLQAKKQDVVRREIWSAAIDLFHERGFDEVTVEQIATRAGVSSRTFFRYFSSKEDVMAAAVKGYGTALSQSILAEDGGLTGFDVARSAISKVLNPHLPATERVVQIAKRSSAARMAQFLQVPMLEEELSLAFASRAKRPGQVILEDRILASLTLSATAHCVEIWVSEQNRPIREIVEEVFRTIVNVCAKPE